MADSKKVVGVCSACKGRVVAVTHKEYDASSGPQIIGPGGASQYYDVTTHHCADCGIAYAFVPPKKKVHQN